MATGTSTTDANLVTTGDQIIPLEVNPRYTFNVTLESNVYTFTVHWNETDTAWYLDILGVSNTEDIKGIKLATGPNLIKPYAILEMGGLYMIDVRGEQSEPDFDNIGSRYLLYYVPTTNSASII